jgi:WD40 repeat protein
MRAVFLFITSVILQLSALFAQAPRLVIPLGHSFAIRDARFSPDGRFVFTISTDHTARLWETISGKEIFAITAHKEDIMGVDFSRDGNMIATCSQDSTARIIDARTGKTIRLLKGHKGWLNTVRFSPDTKTVITTSEDQTAILWNVADGKKILTLQHTLGVVDAFFSKDGKKIFTWNSRDLYAWDISGKLLYNYWPKSTKPYTGSLYGISAVGISPDETSMIATCRDDYTLRIIDAKTGKETRIISLGNSDPRKGILSSDGKIFSVWDGVKLLSIDLVTGITLYTVSFDLVITNARFSHDSKLLVVSSYEGATVLYNALSGKILRRLPGKASIHDFSENSQYMVGSKDNIANLWDLRSGEKVTTYRGHTHMPLDVIIDRNDNSLFASLSSSSVLHIDLKTCSVIGSFTGQTWNDIIAISPDEKYLLSSSTPNTVSLWEISTGKLKYKLSYPGAIKSLEFDGSGERFMVIAEELEVTKLDAESFANIYETSSAKLLQKIRDDLRYVFGGHFNSDGTLLLPGADYFSIWRQGDTSRVKKIPLDGRHPVIGPGNMLYYSTSDGEAIIGYDLANKKIKFQSKGHKSYVNSIEIDATKKFLLTASNDGTARTWNLSNGAPVRAMSGHDWWINRARYSGGGKYIVTASWDQSIKIWSPLSGKLISTIYLLDSNNVVSLLPSGYYQCSPNAARSLHYVTKDRQIVTFEQLDIKYNRPDKVLEAMGNADSLLVKSYKKAWEKRIKKLGVDTSAFKQGINVPEFDFADRP